MKKSLFIFCFALIFAFCFKLNSYADSNQTLYDYVDLNGIVGNVKTSYYDLYIRAFTSDSGIVICLVNPSITSYSNPYYYINGVSHTYYGILAPGSATQIMVANSFSGPIYSSYENMINDISAEYDSSVGIGSELFIVQQGNVFSTQKWGIFWKTPNCSSANLMISGGKKTDSFDVAINSSLWIEPSDYATDNSNIVLYLTPLDSSGNWGNTMSISHYYHSNLLTQGVANAIQLFQGYIAKADNIPDVNIIGIDTVEVVDYFDRPTPSGVIDTTTRINTTTIYSPVYNTTSETVNNIFNEYITNETVYNSVTNNYYTTNNYINKNTTISINLGGGDSDTKENLLIKFLNSRKWFNDTSDEVLDSLKDLKGTPFEFIFDTIATCLSALVGIAIVLLLVKVVGFFV